MNNPDQHRTRHTVAAETPPRPLTAQAPGFRRAQRIASDSRSTTRTEPSGRVARIRAGKDRVPFLTRQISCAPVPVAVCHRRREKYPRSARLRVPGARCPARRSLSSGSATAQEPVTAPRIRRVPHTTRVTRRAWGNRPPAGVANRTRTGSVAGKSTTVPSTAVTTSPNVRNPGRSPGSGRAPAVNNASSTPGDSRARAWDNATAVTGPPITRAGLNAVSRGHSRASTTAYPHPRTGTVPGSARS